MTIGTSELCILPQTSPKRIETNGGQSCQRVLIENLSPDDYVPCSLVYPQRVAGWEHLRELSDLPPLFSYLNQKSETENKRNVRLKGLHDTKNDRGGLQLQHQTLVVVL